VRGRDARGRPRWERESVGAPAGLRAHMLVSLGSALFVLIALQAGMRLDDLM
jgi:putative Mg2+ transporter-C (MgtC) family protein